MRGSLQTIHATVDDFSRLKELIRSSEKIVVISGAGISVSAGFPTFEDMRKSNSLRSTALSIPLPRRWPASTP
ncbi:hypothetical protein LOCC1_G008066, partial [Lachnellula occidentalis]